MLSKDVIFKIAGLGISVAGIVVSSIIEINKKEKISDEDKEDIADRVVEKMNVAQA